MLEKEEVDIEGSGLEDGKGKELTEVLEGGMRRRKS